MAFRVAEDGNLTRGDDEEVARRLETRLCVLLPNKRAARIDHLAAGRQRRGIVILPVLLLSHHHVDYIEDPSA